MNYDVDRLPLFYEKSFKNQSEMTRMIVDYTWRHKIYTEDKATDKLYDKLQDFTVPYKLLKDSLQAISSLKPSIEEAYSFFNSYTSPDFRKRFTKVLGSEMLMYATDEIESLSFDAIAVRFNKNIEKDLSRLFEGRTTIKEIRKLRCSADAEHITCQNFFYSKISPNMSTKRLRDYQNATTYTISDGTVKNVILPFLIDTLDMKLSTKEIDNCRIKIMPFSAIIKRTEKSFETLFHGLGVIRESALTAVNLDGGKYCNEYDIESLFASLYVMVYNIETRVVTYLLRMMRAYMRNIRTIIELKETMSINDGLSSIAYTEEFSEENVSNGINLSITNSTVLGEVADELMTSIVNLTNITDEEIEGAISQHLAVNEKLMGVLGRMTTMDSVMYDVIKTELSSIVQNVDSLISAMSNARDEDEEEGDDDWLPFNKILEKYQLPEDPSQLFAYVRNGYDVHPHYPNATPQQILAETAYFKKVVGDLKADLTRFAVRLKDIYNAVDPNPNEGVLQIRFDPTHVKNWFGGAFDALSQFDVELAKDFRARIVALAQSVFDYGVELAYARTSCAVDREGVSFDTDEVIEYYEEEAEQILAEMHAKYTDLFLKKSRGEAIFFEADENPGSKPVAPKPVINDGGGGNSNNQADQNNKDTNNDQQQNTQNSQDGSKGTSNKISVKLRNALNKIIAMVKKVFDRGDKAKNLKFLSVNKGFLLSRNYTNTSVEMLPYRKDFNYVKLMNECIDRAASIGDGTLKSSNEDGIRNSIFGPLNLPKTGNGLEADLVQCFKVGQGKMENVTVADNNLKSLVPGMIKYCENYYNKFDSDLETLNQSLGKLAVFDTKKNSVEGDKTEDNIKVISDQLRVAMTALRVASRDRCNNYLIILSSLASSNKNASKNQATQETQTPQETNGDNTQQ